MSRDLAFAVIPAFRASDSIERVVRRTLEVVDVVIVVDDGCPEATAAVLERAVVDERLVILRHESNRGVGAAVKTGIEEALRRGASVVFKIDADDQMDVRFVPQMLECLRRHPDAVLVKGNRFAEASTLQTMPKFRLIGNSALTFLVKFASGYWTVVDPTNGFIAMRASMLKRVNLSRLADRYFFEIDLLCSLGLQRVPIAELQMPAIYGNERSSLVIRRVLGDFLRRLATRTVRRFVLNYVVTEINVGSLYAIIGVPLICFGTVFGGYEWYESALSGIPRETGTVIFALLVFMIGFQLTLQAIAYDVQFAPRTYKARIEEDAVAEETLVSVPVGSNF